VVPVVSVAQAGRVATRSNDASRRLRKGGIGWWVPVEVAMGAGARHT
jgi:hypothetical protein